MIRLSRLGVLLLVLAHLVASNARGADAEAAPPAPSATAAATANPAPPSAEVLLDKALANRFELDLVQRAVIVTRDGDDVISARTVEMAIKRIDGRVHSLGHIIEPEYLRGVKLLSIEQRERSDDQFIFLPEARRVRRISGSQRGDAFLGTDVVFDDLERHYADEYTVEDGGTSELQGETVRVVAARPSFASGYDLAVYFIASDGLILEVRFFRDETAAPYRIVRAAREKTVLVAGHKLPGELAIENYKTGTLTSVHFENLKLAANLPESLFAVGALEREVPIPGFEH